MRCLFVHDLRAHKYAGRYYTTNISYEIWKKRYLTVFDEIEVCCRTIKSKEDISKKMVLSDGENIIFNENIPDFMGPEVLINKNVIRELSNMIDNADFLIIRIGSFLGSMAIRLCKKKKKPFITEVVSSSWDAYWNHGVLGKIIAPFCELLEKSDVKKSEYLVYVTNDFLQKRYPSKGTSISCSNVELAKTDISILEKRLKKIDNLKETIRIGTTAALNVKYKGQQYVIKALYLLKKKGITRFEYELVGGGDDFYLKSLIDKYELNDNVKILGRKPHNQINDWLDSLDVYIQPSRQEGLPRALIEAMSRGLLCLGARTAGIPELLQNKRVFENSNKTPEHIAELLEKINVSMLKKDAKINYEESQKYTEDILEKRRYEFFSKCVEKVRK